MKKRDLFLADSHILELEQECNESAAADRVMQPEDATSQNHKDGGRRKAKDVELLYEELQKELWAVVRESLRSPTAGPNLGLVVQVRTGAVAMAADGKCRDGNQCVGVCRCCSRRSKRTKTGPSAREWPPGARGLAA